MLLQDSEIRLPHKKFLMSFHSFKVSSPLYVLENSCFERIPIFYQKKLQFVDQVTRKTFPWSTKAPYRPDNFYQHISHDADGDESYRLTP